jgi:hypothetical protein
VETLQTRYNWEAQEAYRTLFWAYSALGLVKFALALMLSAGCEQEKTNPPTPNTDTETQPLLGDHYEESSKAATHVSFTFRSLLPTLSPESSSIVLKLSLLFALDSLASGLTPGSWISYLYHIQYHLASGLIGTLFFTGMLLASASNLLAPSLAKRIGLIRTMVFTHIPAAIALALIPLPRNVYLSMGLFWLRACTNSMDQPPRQAFIVGAVRPEERTAVMGGINVVKTLAQSVGPSFTGWVAGHSMLWLAFVIAGSLKLVYDALILVCFLGYRMSDDGADLAGEGLEEAEGQAEADQSGMGRAS